MRKAIVVLTAASLATPMTSTAVQARGKSDSKVWRDSEGRYRCKRPDGTAGLVVGAAGGALLGRVIDTKGERATGTILGAPAGALLGRKIERDRVRCR